METGIMMTTYKQAHTCGRCGAKILPGEPCSSDRFGRRVEYFCSEEHEAAFRAAHQAAREERGY